MKKVVIIGNHAAGLSAAETLRKQGDDCEIVLISKEDVVPYSRCLIPYVVSGEKRIDDILFKPKDFYEANSINTMFGVEALKVLVKDKHVLLANGDTITYDALVIATGGTPSPVNIPGAKNRGVFGFRNLEDAERIMDRCGKAGSAVVMGGGLVGLKAAVALRERGLNVSIIVGSPNVLSQIVGAHEAEVFEEYLSGRGIEIRARTSPARILGKDEVEGVETTEGKRIDCQMVVVGKGVRANIRPVENTEIKTEYGIIVDDRCRTNVPDVYAAGDVAQSPDTVRKATWMNALWPHAVAEGRGACENIMGSDTSLKGRTSMNSIKIGEVALISCGLTGAREKVDGAEEITVKRPGQNDYKRFIIKDNRLIGFSLVGNVAHAGVLTSLVTKEIDVEEIKDRFVAGKYDFASILPTIRKNRDKFSEVEYEEVLAFF